jgi:hypothetical protein
MKTLCLTRLKAQSHRPLFHPTAATFFSKFNTLIALPQVVSPVAAELIYRNVQLTILQQWFYIGSPNQEMG